MQKVNFSNPHMVVNFFWNLSIDITIFLGFLYLDPLQLESLGKTCAISKPMFGQLVKLNAQFVYPYIFVVNVSYSYIFSSRIIHLLDSDVFFVFYSQGNKWRYILTGFIGGHFFLCYIFFFDKINFQQFDAKQLVRYGCMYSSLFQYWVCGIFHYFQYATWKIFCGYEKSLLLLEMTTQEQLSILDEIRLLADINANLIQYLSIPILFFIILNIFNIIMFLSMAFLCKVSVGLLIHAFTSALYLVLLIFLNHKLLLSLKRIISIFQKSQFITLEQNHYFLSRISKRTKIQLNEPKESRQIRYAQLNIYSKYYHIKIFQLISLNFNYLLKVSLFIASYVVLISQTTL